MGHGHSIWLLLITIGIFFAIRTLLQKRCIVQSDCIILTHEAWNFLKLGLCVCVYITSIYIYTINPCICNLANCFAQCTCSINAK